MKSATIAIILLNIAIFVLSPFGLDAQNFVNDYGFSTDNALAKPWTWISSLFIHVSLLHILYNMLGLFFFGRNLENEIGYQKFLLVYFIGGFAANIVSMLVLPAETLSVGASGAVFAVIGAAILIKPFGFTMFPFVIPLPLGIVGIIYALSATILFFTETSTTINNAAHFGGLVFGMIYGINREGIKRGAAIIAFFLLVIVLGEIYLLPWLKGLMAGL